MSTVMIYGAVSAGSIEENNSDVISRAELMDLGVISIEVKRVTSNYTATANDTTIFADGQLTITLPAASLVPNKIYNIKRVSTAGPVTIQPIGTDKIDGETAVQLTAKYASIAIVSDGTGWWIF